VLGGIEGSCYLALILFLTHGPVRAMGLALGLTLYAAVLWLLFSPLASKHRLTAEVLTLHLGVLFKAAIPRITIAGVKSTNMRLPGFPGRVAYNEPQGMLVASMSRKGLILMQLAQPQTFKMWPLQRCETDQVLFNVDEPEAFLQAFGETPARVAQPTEVPVVVPPARERQPMSSAGFAIETHGLTKFYGQHVGVEDLNLRVRWGEIYGLLGVNGAGKTTTLKMLVGLLEPTRGQAEICGVNIQDEPRRAKACLGYLPETTIVYEKLTGREFLEFMAELRAIDRAEATDRIHRLLVVLGINEWADQKSSAESGVLAVQARGFSLITGLRPANRRQHSLPPGHRPG
jgi:ABC-type multidrug transport system fused ATPase/permease subunit